MNAVLTCRGVSRVFTSRGVPAIVAVDDVDLEVPPGTFVAIEGPSGSGKTTLLGLMAGIEKPNAGIVRVLGHDLGNLNGRERARLRRASIGLVFQSFGLVASLNAGENVALPLTLDGLSASERREHALAALAGVGLDGYYDARVDELSGGQRQRVGVARALVNEPAIVLADEPTGSLDDETAASILELLRSRTTDIAASLVLVTHDADSAATADERYQMLDGKLDPSTPRAAA